MIFEECKRAGLTQPTVTDERGVVKVTFMRPDLSGHKSDPINDPIKILSDVERTVLDIVKEHPGIFRVCKKGTSMIFKKSKVLIDK